MNTETKDMVDVLAKALSTAFQQHSEETGIPVNKIVNEFCAGLRCGPTEEQMLECE